MATSSLNRSRLLFTTDGTTIGAQMSAGANKFTFVGATATTKVDLEGVNKVTGLATPSAATDAVNKSYVDSKLSGLDIKESVRLASSTAENIDLATFDVDNNAALDNVTLVAGDRILLKDQTTAKENGIYVVQQSGQPQRPTDFASTTNVASAFMFVQEGNTNADKGFVCTNDSGSAIVDDATNGNLAFTQFNGAGGGGGDITAVTATGGLTGGGSTGGVTLSIADKGVAAVNLAGDVVDGSTITGGNGNAISLGTVGPTNLGAVTGTGLTGGSGSAIALDTTITRTAATKFQPATGGPNSTVVLSAGLEDGTTTKFTVQADGTCTGNEFIADSDRTLKKNITPLETSAALATVAAMGPCTYQFKAKPDDPRCGVIAQELAEIAPELVKLTSKGTLAVDYNDMNAYLIGAIQALKSQVEEQADVIQRLSQRIPVAAL